MPKVTIADIAKEANVSKTTISRYLNGRFESMSDDKRHEIESIITRLNYYPNASARSLKSKKSRLIGILISVTDNSRLISQLLQGICGQLKAHAYSPILYDNVAGEEEKTVRECLSQNLDGLIVSPSSTNVAVYDRIVAAGVPIVLVDRYVDAWKHDAVYINNAAAVENAMRHLRDSGFEKIHFLTANTNVVSTKVARQQAFVDFLRGEMAVKNAEDMVHHLPSADAEFVEPVLVEIMKASPRAKKAVFAVDADTLFATLTAVERLGIRIPQDLGVCGYDSWGWTALVPPGITSVVQPINEMAEKAVRLLMKRIESGPGKRATRLKLDTQIVIRGSTSLRS